MHVDLIDTFFLKITSTKQLKSVFSYYLAMAVSTSLEPDPVKAVVSRFVHTLSNFCPCTLIAIVCPCATCLFIFLSQIKSLFILLIIND